uniref:Uncharacterized protein n=1 Tax=Romanomermis culicivorax TaxID=13658 RepID=A0A915J4Y9_ROMCU
MPPANTPTPTATPNLICLSLSSRDSLQLINAPKHLWPPLLDAINAATNGTAVRTKYMDHQNLNITLNGWPWENASLSKGVDARKILLAAFRTFDKMGYHFYGTVNLKGKTDSLFFICDERQPSELHQYCMISLNQNDRLRLIDCPITVINGVRDSIKALSKLKDERNLLIAHEFKLKGYPWMAGGSESVDARLLVATILEKMASVGWPVLTSLDISRRANNKSVFFLRSTDRLSLSSTPSPSYFCISLNATDKVRLINAPNQVVGTLRNVVGTNWGPGIGKSQEYFGSYEMKLNGNPWNTVTKDGLAA